MDFSSFCTSLGTSFVIFLVLMILFALLQSKPGNNVVYYPNRILKGLDPFEGGSKTRNPFSWIKEAFSSSEQDVIAMSGVDTAVFFVFLSTVFSILVICGIILLPVLLPIAVTGGAGKKLTTSEGTFNELDQLSMGNITAKSVRLWAFFIACYFVSLVSLFLLWKAYKHVSWLRTEAFKSIDVKPEQFAIVVRDIPPVLDGQTRKEQVDSYFKAIYPETFYRSMIITDNKKVNKIWEELEGYKKKLARAEVVYAGSKTTAKPEGTRPTNKTGCLGLIGKKVDSIEYCNEKINELVAKLESEQKVTLREKQQNAAIVFFSNRVIAASAAQSLHAQVVDHWSVFGAPEPCQLLWPNLKIKYFQRELRQYLVYFIVTLAIFFYMVPITFVSAFTTLKSLEKLLPFIKPIVKIITLKTVLEAYLPQLALIIFLAMLPKLLISLNLHSEILVQILFLLHLKKFHLVATIILTALEKIVLCRPVPVTDVLILLEEEALLLLEVIVMEEKTDIGKIVIPEKTDTIVDTVVEVVVIEKKEVIVIILRMLPKEEDLQEGTNQLIVVQTKKDVTRPHFMWVIFHMLFVNKT